MKKIMIESSGIRALGILAFAIFVSGLLTGCATTYKTVLDSQVIAPASKMNKEKAFNTITAILIDEGLDVKMANKDIGAVTTEWKKYGALEKDPPFDMYLQLKVRVKELSGSSNRIEVTVTPLSKQANRLNSAAFTEEALIFPDEELMQRSAAGRYVKDTDQIAVKGYSMYNNIVTKIAELCGLSISDVKQNLGVVTKSDF